MKGKQSAANLIPQNVALWALYPDDVGVQMSDRDEPTTAEVGHRIYLRHIPPAGDRTDSYEPPTAECQDDEPLNVTASKILQEIMGIPRLGQRLKYCGRSQTTTGDGDRVTHDFVVELTADQARKAAVSWKDTNVTAEIWSVNDLLSTNNLRLRETQKVRLRRVIKTFEERTNQEKGKSLETTEEELQVIPQGGILRALMAGGHRAVKAVGVLHRRYYHTSVKTLQHLLSLAGAPESLQKVCDDVVKQCSVCRTWERPAAKPMATASLATQVNELMYADILIHHLLSDPDGKPLHILHMLDDASRFRMLELLENRGFHALRDALARWFGILGPPKVLKCDTESALVGEEMRVHLEGKLCRLDPNPTSRGGATSSHTPAGTIEGHNRVVRTGLHRAETAAKSLGLGLTRQELVQEVQWCTNAVPGWQGVSASQGALGHTPRDPMNVQEVTSTAATDPRERFLDRMRMRSVCCAAIQQEIIQQRLQRVANAKVRTGSHGIGSEFRYDNDDEVEITRDPQSKDLKTWRGPCKVINASLQKDGKIGVEWAGSSLTVPLNKVRPFNPNAFFAASKGGTLTAMMSLVGSDSSYSKLVGLIPTDFGNLQSNSMKEDPEAASTVEEGAKELGFTIHGAAFGQGIHKMPPIRGRPGAGVLIWWMTGHPQTLKYQVMQSHWPINLKKICGDPTSHSFLFYYAFDGVDLLPEGWPEESFNRGPREEQEWPSDHAIPTMPEVQRDQRISWRELQRNLRDRLTGPTEAVRAAARTVTDATQLEIGEQSGASIGESIGRALGHSVAGPAGGQLGGTIGSNLGGRLGERAASVTTGNQSAGSTAPTAARRDCSVMHTWEEDLRREMEAIPDELEPPSLRCVLLSKKEKFANGQELTKEEERLFWREVQAAKKKELQSWAHHKVFDIVQKKEVRCTPQSCRWVLSWKVTMDEAKTLRWTVKARMCPRGNGDRQGQDLLTRSPTAARVAQRWLVCVAALWNFDLVSMDISTAFLQGTPIKEQRTKLGEAREAAIIPPADAWDLLPADFEGFIPPKQSRGGWLWDLLKGAYGLKDAPLMCIMELFRFVREDLVVTIESSNNLCGMLTVHVDDVCLAASKRVIQQVHSQGEKRFGKIKLQQDRYTHVGRDYEKMKDGGYRVGHQSYLNAQQQEPIGGRFNELLCNSKDGLTHLRSVRGVLQYGVQDRPEAMGKLAALSTKEDEATWNDVKKANEILAELMANADDCSFWYPPLVPTPPQPGVFDDRLMMVLICDSAFKNAGDKHSQGAYCIGLCARNKDGTIGGLLYVIEVCSRKSKRVAKSTWAAELHALVNGLERIERATAWWREIVDGPSESRGLQRLKDDTGLRMQTVAFTDCKGLWESVTAPVTGSVADVSMMVYLTAARESLDLGLTSGFAWIPTEDMLVDACTEGMRDVCWNEYYRTGVWKPREVILCERVEKGKHSISKRNVESSCAMLVEEDETADDELQDLELQHLYARTFLILCP